MIAKFLRAASEKGAVAFGPVDPKITPEQAAEIFDTDLFFLISEQAASSHRRVSARPQTRNLTHPS